MRMAQEAAVGLGGAVSPAAGPWQSLWWRLRGYSLLKCFGLTSKIHKYGLKQHSKNTFDSLTKHVIYQILGKYNIIWSSISHPVAVVRESGRDICPCSITLARRYTLTKHRKANLPWCSYRWNEHSGLCLFNQ